MEFVGRKVKKGQTPFAGSVQEFDPKTGFFKIVYDDGDSVEMGLSELHKSLLASAEFEGISNKRPRFVIDDNSGMEIDQSLNGSSFSVNLVNEGENSSGVCLNLNKVVDLNDDLLDKSNDEVGCGSKLNGLDLNDSVNLELNEGLDLNKEDVLEECSEVKNGSIDLNRDVNEDVDDDLRGKGKNRSFDLNLELMEDEVMNVDGCEGDGRLKKLDEEVSMKVDGDMGNLFLNVENKEEDLLKNLGNGVGNGNVVAPVSLPKRRGRKRKDVSSSNVDLASPETEEDLSKNLGNGVENGNVVAPVCLPKKRGRKRKDVSSSNVDLASTETEEDLLKNLGNGVENENMVVPISLPKRSGRKRKDASISNVELASPETTKVDDVGVKLESKRSDETPLKGFSDSAGDVSVILCSASGRRRGRKKKELLANTVIVCTPETGLRRSSRRAKNALLVVQDNVSDAAELEGINHRLCSPTISAVSDEKVAVETAHYTICPQKVELPPSSRNLEIDCVSPFDLLSVYAFLRSFSTFLFLSPFELDQFVEAVKCKDSTVLFDSIHVSLLRILKKNLESLSNEGSASASNCLRSLNWDFIDLITWPLFVFEYLLLHSPGYIPGLNLRQSKPFESDYYKLPVSAKVEILKHLCDDVLEVESFRLEMNRRTMGTDRESDFERNKKFGSSRKRKSIINVASSSCLTTLDDIGEPDLNSDECYLCKMDGNLICCDGCPAAFHSRCVGVVSNLLPEGDWYCPECKIEKDNPWMKIGQAIRGAELLGIDLFNRRFHSSCGYLLVSESHEDKYSYWSYSRNDIPTLIEALESSPYFYGSLIRAICKHWNIVQGVRRARKSTVASYLSSLELENADHVTVVQETDNVAVKMDNQVASSEGSAEVSQAFIKTDTVKDSILTSLKAFPEIQNDTQRVDTGNRNMIDMTSDFAFCNNITDRGTNYVNYYEFALEASSVLTELLLSKSSGKISENVPKTVEEIVAAQLKAISNRICVFTWSNSLISSVNCKKENCGWCLYCKYPEMATDCLSTNLSFPNIENFTSEALGVVLGENKENHLIDVMSHMICIEDHLQGLLLGPWLNSHYSILWRKSVIEAADVTSLKSLLLMVESNLHHRALSADWRKHVDYVAIVGSASQIVKNFPRASSKHGIDGKRASGLSIFWWRGGSGSRKLFNWKVLPRSLASKAARQGGCKKIPGVLYPESGENTKRTKFDAWKAAVETSRTVDQLALQIRELDTNILWDEIGNINRERDPKKSMKSFRKVIIRKKCSEGPVPKYLLDFGKRRFIPDIVMSYGSVFNDSTSERKKYWLEECYLPLHLLKSFEEKRIARKSNKMASARESSAVMRRPIKKKGFSYLFEKAERSENYQCGLCKKDVLTREAVSCKHCKGFFHKSHVRKQSGSVTAESMYTCRKCHGGKSVKLFERKGKYQVIKNASQGLNRLRSGKGKNSRKKKQQVNSENKKRVQLVVPLRRSARCAERIVNISLKKNRGKKQKKKQAKSAKDKSKKTESGGWEKKKRATVCGSYWLNGLHLSKRPDDERLMHFKSKKLLVISGELSSRRIKPKCSLCDETEYAAELNYLACESCRDWFHGDAWDLNVDKIKMLIGFKCHKCLNRMPPVCPHNYPAGSSKSKLVSELDCNDWDL